MTTLSNDLNVLLDQILCEQQVQTVFQPIVSLREGNLLGYEALSRGPKGTPLENPENLFSFAMDKNRLWDLESLCRTKALERAHELQACGKLFLNVNPNIMNDMKFIEGFTKEYLDTFNMNASSIVFEITEREAIKSLTDFKRTVHYYKNQSYQIAIDDVGSGYSGLNAITDIHPHYIKLDMNLIRDIHKDQTKLMLVKSLCEFANMSDIKMIAEGIETAEELYCLIDIGVHYGQGYFVQRPSSQLLPVNQKLKECIRHAFQKKNKLSYQTIADIWVEQIVTPLPTLPSTILIDEVNRMFEENPTVPGYCVVEEDQVVGVITRSQLHMKISGLYGYSLHAHKPIATIMQHHFLAVNTQTPIDIVAKMAMMREAEHLYDFITVVKDGKYVGIVTVKELLEKAMQIQIAYAKHLNPLTELPGNLMIEQKLQSYFEQASQYGVLYLDIDHFKPYNDTYGFEMGDQILIAIASILKETVSSSEFIGHIGGDDFILVVSKENTKRYCELIIERFQEIIQNYYQEADWQQGYIIAKNRKGEVEQFPLLSISIVGIVDHRFETTFELAECAAQLKRQCKRLLGSQYLLMEGHEIVSSLKQYTKNFKMV